MSPKKRWTRVLKLNCKQCNSEISRRTTFRKIARPVFCSDSCRKKRKLDYAKTKPERFLKIGKIKKCEICSGDIPLIKQNKSFNRTCSSRCRGKLRSLELIGANSPSWKGGPSLYLQRKMEKYPEKLKARSKLGSAVKSSKISRPTSCQKCNSIARVEGHHLDYNRPLDVVWLCSSCHRAWHKK